MCAQDYLFSAEEQRFWYETPGFFVQSAPMQCPDCRREIRKKKQAQRTLQALLPLAPDCSWQQLEEVAQAAAVSGARNAIDINPHLQRIESKIAVHEVGNQLGFGRVQAQGGQEPEALKFDSGSVAFANLHS